MNQQPIGLIDSGLGGFTIYYGLKKAYPKAPLMILADQYNSPYGPKSKEQLYDITSKNIEFFHAQGVRHLLLACNTTSSLLLKDMQEKYPEIAIRGVIDATVNQIQETSKIAVVATQANIFSHVYKNEIVKRFPSSEVIEVIAHDLVDYIEGLADKQTIAHYVATLCNQCKDVDTILLGCTHYPLVINEFKACKDVVYIDSTQAMVLASKDWLENNIGDSTILTSASAQVLQRQLHVLFNAHEEVVEVSI